MIITSELIRAARALLRWEQKDLAEASSVSLPSIKRLETQPGPLAAQDRTVEALRAAIDRAGVEFTNGEQPGLKLRAARVGDTVRYTPNGRVGTVINQVPNMGGMVWVEFSDGPMSVEKGRLVILPRKELP
jgi:predicted transcriptional regulator